MLAYIGVFAPAYEGIAVAQELKISAIAGSAVIGSARGCQRKGSRSVILLEKDD